MVIASNAAPSLFKSILEIFRLLWHDELRSKFKYRFHIFKQRLFKTFDCRNSLSSRYGKIRRLVPTALLAISPRTQSREQIRGSQDGLKKPLSYGFSTTQRIPGFASTRCRNWRGVLQLCRCIYVVLG